MTLTWVNMYFKLDIVNPRDLTARVSGALEMCGIGHVMGCFEAGFPIIILTMMDVIYPKKVRWHQATKREEKTESIRAPRPGPLNPGKVDWNVAYMRAVALGG